MDISQIKSAYFIGVGGIGISALARLMLSRGIAVSGVNDDESPTTIDPLRALGAQIVIEQNLQSVPEADVYVYSDAWIYRGPQLIASAKETGKPVLSYFEALGQIAKGYEKVIAVAGVHGKTTTTAMIAEVLEAGGLNPTVIVGSLVKKYASNFRPGSTEYLVVEADEYMRHFLNFDPYISVITNIEADHLDYYKDLADVQSAFVSLLGKTSRAVVCDPSDALVAPVLTGKELEILDWQGAIADVPKLMVPGEHNRKDAACALAVARALGVPDSVSGPALVSFAGTWRRLENRGTTNAGVIVYDDYAHHPTEAKASLQALRELYPKGQKRITVLFQPHLYSRTKALFADFVTAFTEADAVFFLPIYFAREAHDPTVSSELLAQAVSEHVHGARAFADFTEAEDYFLSAGLGSDDVVVTMGAGEAYKIGTKMLEV
jgi:UDP-N-acetylmuramate--alanine ligase